MSFVEVRDEGRSVETLVKVDDEMRPRMCRVTTVRDSDGKVLATFQVPELADNEIFFSSLDGSADCVVTVAKSQRTA